MLGGELLLGYESSCVGDMCNGAMDYAGVQGGRLYGGVLFSGFG